MSQKTQQPKALQLLVSALESKDYFKAYEIAKEILEHYPDNTLVRQIKEHLDVQIQCPIEKDPDITQEDIDNAEKYDPHAPDDDYEEEEEEEEDDDEDDDVSDLFDRVV